MTSWEERMAQRAGGMNAQERSHHRMHYEDPTPGWREAFEQSKLDDGFTLVGGTEVMVGGKPRIVGGKWFKPEPPEGPNYCRECSGWDSEEGIWKVTCGFLSESGCSHDHHDGEVWLA